MCKRDSHRCGETGWWVTTFKVPVLYSGKGKRVKILVVGAMNALAFIFIFFFLLFYSFLSRGVDLSVLNFHLPLQAATS